MAKKVLNVGLVGYQFMGKAHSNSYRQLSRFSPELEVAPALKAICGRHESAVAEAASQFGWVSFETDWRRLIERGEIDVIDIATPGNLHAEILLPPPMPESMYFAKSRSAVRRSRRDECSMRFSPQA